MSKHPTPTAKQISAQNTARLKLGTEYSKVMADHGEQVLAHAKARDIDIFTAATELAAAGGLDGYGQLYFTAAAVEIVQPGSWPASAPATQEPSPT